MCFKRLDVCSVLHHQQQVHEQNLHAEVFSIVTVT